MALKDKCDGVRFARMPKQLNAEIICDHCKMASNHIYSLSTPLLDDNERAKPYSPAIYFCHPCGYNLANAILKEVREAKS